MNIQRNIERNAVPFGEIKVGQVYEVGNTIYLKIDPIYSVNARDALITIDSIDLDIGKPQENFLDDTDIVVLLNATLVIKD